MASKKYIVAFDQGTTSSRAVVFDHNAQVVSIAQKEFTQIYPQTGWVEHDPMEIWATQNAVWIEALSKANLSTQDIAAIGITNQRETTVIWDKKTGQPIYNAIVWQSRQSMPICQTLKQQGLEQYIRDTTGLLIDPYFSATKIKWILDHVSGSRERAKKGELLFGTVDTWLIWKLTGGKSHVTDYTNASRTMLFNIDQLDWDQTLLDALDIPREILPKVQKSSAIYGYSHTISGQEYSIPIAGVAGDQQAALFGQLCIDAGQSKNTYGTGCFLLMNTGKQRVHSQHGLITTLACDAQGDVAYALEGAIFNAGSSVHWLRDELKIIRHSKDSEKMAMQVENSNGVYLVPAFTGLGAPYWDPEARGAIFGLTRGANRNHIVRATLESIAYQVRDVLDAMQQDAQQQLTTLRVDGGATDNHFLMQFQADVLSTTVEKTDLKETTSLGVALLAGLAVGFWKDITEIKDKILLEQCFQPCREKDEMDKLYRKWRKAVARSREWEKED